MTTNRHSVFSGGLIGLLILFCFIFLAKGLILFGLLVLIVNGLALLRVTKMQAGIEEKRQGKVTRALCGFLGLLLLQWILSRHAQVMDISGEDMLVPRALPIRQIYYHLFLVLVGVVTLMTTVREIRVLYFENPPIMVRYLTAMFAGGIGASLTSIAVLLKDVIVVQLTEERALVFDLRLASLEIFFALLLLQVVMARLYVQEEEEATVYLFDNPVYRVTHHSDVLVPPIFLTLQMLTDLIGQKSFFFSIDYSVLREPITPRQRVAVSVEEGGLSPATRVAGRGAANDEGRVSVIQ